ncbi:MAG: MarR family transcriptional regulator [Aquihabitans sp.]
MTTDDRTERLADTASRLRFTSARLTRILRQQADLPLTLTQLSALATISNDGPMPIGTLADLEHVSAPTATKVIDKLHADGLVDRVGDPTDRRRTLVSATKAGDELLNDHRARKTAWLSTRLAELPHDDIDRLTAALEVLERLTEPPEPMPPEQSL